jgi:hypothetical protein
MAEPFQETPFRKMSPELPPRDNLVCEGRSVASRRWSVSLVSSRMRWAIRDIEGGTSMKIRSFLLPFLFLVIFACAAEGSIPRKFGSRPLSPCQLSQYDACNQACDFFDSQCWYNCMWGGPGSGTPGTGTSSSAFGSCANTCGNPCKTTACDAVCRNSGTTACTACCNIAYNRAKTDCKGGLLCIDTQTSEWNSCKTACGTPM